MERRINGAALQIMANNSFLFGAVVGAAAAVWLLTTDKGKEVLAKAGNWADRAQGTAKDLAGKAQDAAKDLAGKAQDAFEEAKEQFGK